MLDPKKQSEIDQGFAALVDNFVPMWRRMYLKALEEGFDEAQSLALVKAYILSQGSGDKRP